MLAIPLHIATLNTLPVDMFLLTFTDLWPSALGRPNSMEIFAILYAEHSSVRLAYETSFGTPSDPFSVVRVFYFDPTGKGNRLLGF